jgi:trehalose 6-phosphate phosphatase
LRLICNGDVRKASAALLPMELRGKLKALGPRFPGSIVEDKGASVAVHYRFCADRRTELLAAIEGQLAQQADDGLTVLPGHFVFEVKYKRFDKGTAVAALMETEAFAGRMPVVIGDDITDEAAFRVALARGGRAYSVGRDVPGMSGRFYAPKDVRRWLTNMAALPAESEHAAFVQAG